MTALTSEPILIVDCQTTGSSPKTSDILELGWGIYRAEDSLQSFETTTTHKLVEPEDLTIPRRVKNLTGISETDLSKAVNPSVAWSTFKNSLESTEYMVAHYSQFEIRFLSAWSEKHGGPSDLEKQTICTHELARRLLDGLPRKGIRPVAGYWGHSLPEEKRTSHHVLATALIWKKLTRRATEKHGIETTEELREWINSTDPDNNNNYEYLIDRDRRLALPDRPGIYRMLNRNDQVLYVGKATSLRSRVNSYFQSASSLSESKLELVSQVNDVEVVPVDTALEASLLEVDQIKKHEPRYNSNLLYNGRTVLYASQDLKMVSQSLEDDSMFGPFVRQRTIDVLRTVVQWLNHPENPREPDNRRLKQIFSEPAFDDGLNDLIDEWNFSTFQPLINDLRKVGLKLWKDETETEVDEIENSDEKSDSGNQPLTKEEIKSQLESIIKWRTRSIRRGRWLRRLQSALLYWKPDRNEDDPWWYLDLAGGEIQSLKQSNQVTGPDKINENNAIHELDPVGFDRLRVLTTELKRISSQKKPIRLYPSGSTSSPINGREIEKILYRI